MKQNLKNFLKNNKIVLFIEKVVFIFILSIFFFGHTAVFSFLEDLVGYERDTVLSPAENLVLSKPNHHKILWAHEVLDHLLGEDDILGAGSMNLTPKDWKGFLNEEKKEGESTQDLFPEIFYKNFAQELFDLLPIRYIVLSSSEEYASTTAQYINKLDSISWLNRLDVESGEVVFYENEIDTPHVFYFDTLFEFGSLSQLEDGYKVISEDVKKQFYFTIIEDDKKNKNTIKKDIYARLSEGRLEFYRKFWGEVALSEGSFGSLNEKNVIKSFDTSENSDYYVLSQSKVILLEEGKELSFGKLLDSGKIKFFSGGKNLIPNPSFEDGFGGLWSRKVIDCHAFDNYPDIAMGLSKKESSDGVSSLVLNATNHSACNSVKIPVSGGSDYLFSFDYQSPNSKVATYYIEFDSFDGVSYADIEIKNDSWGSFSRIVRAPDNASFANIFVYAKSVDGKKEIVNRYDNFHFVELPKLNYDEFGNSDEIIIFEHLVRGKDKNSLLNNKNDFVIEPEGVSYESAGFTNFSVESVNRYKNIVRVKGARQPFYIGSGEMFGDRWVLSFYDKRVLGILDSWSPFVFPRVIEQHYVLNGLTNAWYIVPEDICDLSEACVRNENGTYDMEFVLEFSAQRWFYFKALFFALFILFFYFLWPFFSERIKKIVFKATKVLFRFSYFSLNIIYFVLKKFFIFLFFVLKQVRRFITWFFGEKKNRDLKGFVLAFLILFFGQYLFWISVLFFIRFKWNYKYTAQIAFLFLLACPYVISIKQNNLADIFSIYAYLFLVATLILQTAEYVRHPELSEDKKNVTEKKQ